MTAIRRCIVVLIWFGCLNGLMKSYGQAITDASTKGGSTLTISVQNTELTPVSGAQIELLNWTGKWEPTRWNGSTNETGQIAFENVVLEFGSVLVRHPDYAVVMHDLSIEATTDDSEQSTRHVRVKLAPAVESHLNIVGPDGKPVADAQIGFLLVTHPELDLSMAMTAETLRRLGNGDYTSDSTGRLVLPPLPAGSVVQLQAHHANLAPVAIDNYHISKDATPILNMTRGAQLELELMGDAVEQGELEDVGVYLRLFGKTPGIENRMMHTFRAVDGKFRLGVHKLHYSSMYLESGDWFITPKFGSGTDPIEDLNLTSDSHVLRAKVRRTHAVTGRLIDSTGLPVANANLSINTVNEVFDATSKTWQPHKTRPWTSVDYVTTSADGQFQTKLPVGPIQVHVNDGPCFLDEPNGFRFDYEGAERLPDIQVRRLPTIRAAVRDLDQRPIPQAIVRVVGQIATSYHVADENGIVSLALTERPRDETNENPSFFVELVAFDPYSSLAGTCRLDLRDTAACDDCVLLVQPRELEWPHQRLQSRDQLFQSWQQRSNPEASSFVQEHPLAEVGTPVDSLTSGIWTGTDARSLNGFRGQYVLLDFWFIGCGPCQRELPSVKLAHELYRELGFSVVSVHVSGIAADQVQQYALSQGMSYPLVVDPPEGPISKKYQAHGVTSYPTYILLDPAGKIASHSSTSREPNLRLHLIESIRLALLRDKD